MVSLWMISVSLHGGHLRVRSPDIIFGMWAPALSPRLYWVQSGGVLVELDALLRTGRSPLCALRMWVELRWLSLCEACALVCVFLVRLLSTLRAAGGLGFGLDTCFPWVCSVYAGLCG